MSQIHDLEKRLRNAFPAAAFELSAPALRTGFWFLDVVHEGNHLIIQWSRGGPFGLSSGNTEAGYGEKPDEVYQDADDAFTRAYSLLKAGAKTQPPPEVTLRELRAERKLTQVQLAKLLGVEQPAVSRGESQVAHMHLSTLRNFLRAMGGRMVVQVFFDDGVVRSLRLDDEVCAEEPAAADA